MPDIHLSEAGGDRNELTDDGDEAPDKGGEFAVIAIIVFGLTELSFVDEEPFGPRLTGELVNEATTEMATK
jgi:hypothetical protein